MVKMQKDAKNWGVRVTAVPFREWPLHARVIERLYRWTHHGQIRTLVIRPRAPRAPTD